MLSFKEWLIENQINPLKKKNKNEQSNNQRTREVRTIHQQRQAPRPDQEVQSANVHVFTEPR
jgi:hypothetical protein